jgi:hypothetical protein
MSAANPNPMEKSLVSVLVVANAGGGSPLPCGVFGLHGGSPVRRPLCTQGTWTRQRVVDLKHGETGEYSPHTLRTVLGQSPVGT